VCLIHGDLSPNWLVDDTGSFVLFDACPYYGTVRLS
jgi:hypothetical protein